MKTYPPVSIVIVTLNNERTIEKCLFHIQNQSYPKNKIELINIDGGSSDNTVKICKKYQVTSYKSHIKKNAEAQRAIGIGKAKNNLIVSIDADNYLLDRDWIKKMIKPFMENQEVVHSNTIHFAYDKHATLFNRYCALFGILDPIVYYVGRPDRLPYSKNKWILGKKVTKKKGYYLVTHTEDTLPTVGCNGVVYRKDYLTQFAKSSPQDFLHIDVFVDVIRNGYTAFAVVDAEVFHDTAVDLISLLRKRILFLRNYYLSSSIKRRYLIYDSSKVKDTMKLLLFALYTLTIVKPLYDSFRGYLIIRDIAWFLHPIVCLVYLFSYGYATTIKLVNKL